LKEAVSDGNGSETVAVSSQRSPACRFQLSPNTSDGEQLRAARRVARHVDRHLSSGLPTHRPSMSPTLCFGRSARRRNLLVANKYSFAPGQRGGAGRWSGSFVTGTASPGRAERGAGLQRGPPRPSTHAPCRELPWSRLERRSRRRSDRRPGARTVWPLVKPPARR